MSLTIPSWLPVVPAGMVNEQSTLPEIQGNYAALGSTIPICYGPFQIGGRPYAIHYASNTWTVGYLVCMGEIQSIQNVWINGAAPVAGVTVHTYVGTTTQGVDSLLAAAIGAGYTDKLVTALNPGSTVILFPVGIAHIVVQYTNTHYTNWPSVVIEGEGRKGWLSSVAEGYMQWPALYLRDFITQFMHEKIDDASVAAVLAANQQYPQGNISYSRRGGYGVIIDSAKSADDWLEVLRNYAGCFLTKRGDTWFMIPDFAVEPTRTLYAKDFVRGSFVPSLSDSSQVPTRVTVYYSRAPASPQKLWIEDTQESTDPDVEIGAVPLRESFVRMSGIHIPTQAAWEARERRQKLALGLTFVGVVADDNCVLEEGDVVEIYHPRLTRQTVLPPVFLFRITEARIIGRGRMRIAGAQYSNDAYLLGGTTTTYPASGGGSGVIGI